MAGGKRKTTRWKVEDGKGNFVRGVGWWIWRWFGGVRGKVVEGGRAVGGGGWVGERL